MDGADDLAPESRPRRRVARRILQGCATAVAVLLVALLVLYYTSPEPPDLVAKISDAHAAYLDEGDHKAKGARFEELVLALRNYHAVGNVVSGDEIRRYLGRPDYEASEGNTEFLGYGYRSANDPDAVVYIVIRDGTVSEFGYGSGMPVPSP
jgi:hypothetical protein